MNEIEMKRIQDQMTKQVAELQMEAWNRGFQNCLDIVIQQLQNPPDSCFEHNSFSRLYFVQELKKQIEGLKK